MRLRPFNGAGATPIISSSPRGNRASFPHDRSTTTVTRTLTHKGVLSWSLAVAAAWTLVVGGALAWNLLQHKRVSLALAEAQAEMVMSRDILYRQWNSQHGGVYVPVTEKTPANPYLAHVPERDITTPSGRQLTLMNHAYMTRKVYELAQEQGQLGSRLTSLRPRVKANAPDGWEARALRAFEGGHEQATTIVKIDGQKYLRRIKPLRVGASCMECHADQGYAIGDIRGGISVTMPLSSFELAAHERLVTVSAESGAIWVLGLTGIGFGARSISRRIRERQEAHREIQQLARFPADNPNPVLRVSAEGDILYANSASAPLLAVWQTAPGRLLPEPLRKLAAQAYTSGEVCKGDANVGQTAFALTFAPITASGYVNVYAQDITDRRRHEQQLAHLATHDPLTGLPNRRLFNDVLKRAVARARRGRCAALLLIDVDCFKEVNDTRGHAAGDAVLKQVTRLIRKNLRAEDVLARVGGDEFAAVLEGVTAEQARPIAERSRQSVERHVFFRGRPVQPTLSIGLVELTGLHHAETAMKQADAAMYQAKEQGRNRVIMTARDSKMMPAPAVAQPALAGRDTP